MHKRQCLLMYVNSCIICFTSISLLTSPIHNYIFVAFEQDIFYMILYFSSMHVSHASKHTWTSYWLAVF